MNMQPESQFETVQRKEKIKPLQEKWGTDWKRPILDVGGGDGSVWEGVSIPVPIDLVEPDYYLRTIADSKFIYNVSYSDISEVHDPAFRYSAVVCLGVLEHLDDYELMMKFLWKYDRIYITVPNADSLHRHIGVSMGLLEHVNDLHEGDIAIDHKRVWRYDQFVNVILDFNSKFNANHKCQIGTVGFKFLDADGMIPFLQNYSGMCAMAERLGYVGESKMNGAEIYAYLEK